MKKFLLVPMMFIILTGASYAFEVGGHAGLYIPGSDMNDRYDYGYKLGLYLDNGFFPMLKWRLGGNYYTATGSFRGNDNDFSAYGGDLSVIFTAPLPAINLYAGLGYGLYQNTETIRNVRNKTEFGHGIVAQAGVGMSIFIVNLGLYARYFQNNLESSKIDAGGYTIGLSAGIGF